MKKRQQKFYTPEQGEVSRENYRPKEKFFCKEKRFNIEVSAINERQAEYINYIKYASRLQGESGENSRTVQKNQRRSPGSTDKRR